MQTIVLQSPEMAYQVLSGSGDVKHPDSSKSPKCSPVTLRIPIFKGLLVPGYEERIFNGAKCRCLQGGIVFFFFFFLLGAALCSRVVFTLSSSPELENPHC